MPQKKKLSPQEKKALSYKKDRRNTYGENDKSSRKNIRLGKKLSRRKMRRLGKGDFQADDGQVEAVLKKEAHWRFEKFPDAPLGGFVENRLRARKTRVGARKARAKLRRRLGP